MRAFRVRMAASAAALALAPGIASAHLAPTGLGPVYDGIYHLALTPRQILPMAAIALYAGLRGPGPARAALFALPPAWLVGCAVGGAWLGDGGALLTATITLTVGALLAAAAELSTRAIAAVAASAGFGLGVCYEAPGGLGPGFGGIAVVIVLVALLASLSLPLRRMQGIIAVRVVGSWTAALGMLLIGWFVHGPGR